MDDGAAPGTTEEQLRDRPSSADGSADAWWTARDAELRRRRRRVLALTATAVAVVGLASASLLDAVSPENLPPAAAGPVSAPDGNLYDGPARGSLAGDEAFVEGVRALPWSPTGDPAGPEVPVADRHVVFAGDVPGGRWALVVADRGSVVGPASLPGDAGTGPDLLDAVWFTGPPGAAAGELSPTAYPGPLKPAWPTALLDQATGVLVVVVSPQDYVEVSERPEIAADGSTSREYRRVEADDGVAVVRLEATGGSVGTAAVYRVVGEVTATPITPWTTVLDAPPAAPVIGYPRGEPREPGRTAADYAAQRVLGELGLAPDDLEVTAQWVGDVPARGPGQAAVVTVTLPNGAVVVDGQWLLPPQVDGTVQGADCGRDVLPAGAPAARRVYALVCEVVDDTSGAPMQTSMVVVAPPDVVLVRTYDGDGGFLSEHPARDGVVVSRLPLGTQTVEAVTSDGISLGRAGLLGDTSSFSE